MCRRQDQPRAIGRLASASRSQRQSIGFALALAVAALLAQPGSAADRDQPRAKAETHQHRPPVVRHYRNPEAIVERERSEGDRGPCLAPVSGLGTQWIGLAGALAAARKDWMERVRYDHGESFVDMSHAAGAVSRCGRVSIGSLLGRVMYRCEIIARPCKAQFVQGPPGRLASLAPPAIAPAPPTAPAAAPPQTTEALPKTATAPPQKKKRLAVLSLFKHALRRHHYRAPARATDKTPPSAQVAARFMAPIVLGALATMERAPTSAIAFAHKLLNAAFEFPIIYRALALGVPPD